MPIRVCFVCLGNICRSPTAEGVMQHLLVGAGLVEHVIIDSAGTGAWHAGEPPDPRSTETALRYGVRLRGQARRFRAADFERFEYVVAMDRDNRENLHALAGSNDHRDKISLLRDFDPDSPRDADVPDPYYGGSGGFDRVFEICQAGCRGLLEHLRRSHGIG